MKKNVKDLMSDFLERNDNLMLSSLERVDINVEKIQKLTNEISGRLISKMHANKIKETLESMSTVKLFNFLFSFRQDFLLFSLLMNAKKLIFL